MTSIAVAYVPVLGRLRPSFALLLLAVILTALLTVLGEALPWVAVYPESWEVRVDTAISLAMKWLINDADLGLFTFKQMTRTLGALLDAPTLFLKGLLVTGFTIAGEDETALRIPPLSWIAVIAIFVSMGVALKDKRLTLFIAASFLYVAFLGVWESAMLTFASIIVVVVIGIVVGVLLGVAAHRWIIVDRILTPVFDFMQTMPVFAYLVPALMLFGYGPASALVVTLIYAMPPMARVTKVALSQVSEEVVEFGRMAGCSRLQLTWQVMVPSIRPHLMVGVNQVIMLALNMVIIASMIGAGGLGFDVWQSLKALRIGQGAEAGIAITLVAIVLDRVSQRFAARGPTYQARYQPFHVRHRALILALAIAIITTIAGIWYSPFAAVPADWTVTTGRFWDSIIDWININLHVYIGAVRDAFFIYLLKPVKSFMLSLPWLGVVLTIAALGFHLGGMRLALVTGALIAFIAVVGLWEKAMISAYLVGICVFLACLIGIPIGVLAARSDRVHKVVQVIIDTLQTLPAFVYLIPVIMLFSVGDFSAMVAVVLYALVPAIRYTDHGIRQVPAHVVEAARSVGCTRGQLLKSVELPLALPNIMLGVNQTLMMGLSMLVITALVGTRDLGQETLIAISKVDPGRGLTAGICVAFIAITADRLINAWAERRRKELGLDVVAGA
ncbi:MAG: ABC transporter permease subunit [Hyphomicrobiaceae bacterium]